MTVTLLFHIRDKGVVKKLVYDNAGRKVSEEKFKDIKNVVLENTNARLPTGLYSNITLYIIDGNVDATRNNAILVVKRANE
ncbi:MAG TPA: hypothetical protein EYP33_07635 [Pyrodictium sp.]|nr:hypothetical protein [Pyrodictium sp.]